MTCVSASCALDDACRSLVFVILTCLNPDGGNISRQITQFLQRPLCRSTKHSTIGSHFELGLICYVAILIAQMHAQSRLWTFIRTARLANCSHNALQATEVVHPRPSGRQLQSLTTFRKYNKITRILFELRPSEVSTIRTVEPLRTGSRILCKA